MTNNKVLSLISAVSIAIFVFLIWFIYMKEPALAGESSIIQAIPFFNASMNIITSFLLVSGFVAIKKGNRDFHKKLMISALASSALFLVGYLLYHHFHGDTKFIGVGILRYVYFFILITHILLSMIQVPMILYTFYLAFAQKFDTHKKWAKFTFPVWLYVSVTGVLVFIFLKFLNY